MASDSKAKKAWDKKHMVFIGLKLFLPNGDRQNDGDIIEFLSDKVKGETIKKALRYYIKNYKENEP